LLFFHKGILLKENMPLLFNINFINHFPNLNLVSDGRGTVGMKEAPTEDKTNKILLDRNNFQK